MLPRARRGAFRQHAALRLRTLLVSLAYPPVTEPARAPQIAASRLFPTKCKQLPFPNMPNKDAVAGSRQELVKVAVLPFHTDRLHSLPLLGHRLAQEFCQRPELVLQGLLGPCFVYRVRQVVPIGVCGMKCPLVLWSGKKPVCGIVRSSAPGRGSGQPRSVCLTLVQTEDPSRHFRAAG